MSATTMTDPALFDHLLAALGLGFPILGALTVRKAVQSTEFDRRARITGFWANGAILFGAGGLVLLAWWLADRGTPGFVYPLENQALATSLIALYMGFYAYDGWRSIHSPEAREKSRRRLRETTPFMPGSWNELPHGLFLCAAAGVGEELLFRAHLITWIQAVGGGHAIVDALAVGIPGLLFALAHRYQENSAVVHIAGMSWVFGIYFLLTGSIVLLVVLHFLIDALGCVMGIMLCREVPEAA